MIKQKLFRFLTFLIFGILATGPSLAQTSQTKSLLWKIEGKGLKEPSYLFGTYHLLTNKFIHEYQELVKPFEEAKGVVVEVVIDSTKLQGLASMAVMPDKKISDLISNDDFKSISSELESTVGVNLNMMNQLKPVSVSLLLTYALNQSLNKDILEKYKGIPMDYYLAKSGEKLNKKVTALETIEEQMHLIYDYYSLEEQANQLVSFVKQKELVAQSQINLIHAYLERDLMKLNQVAESVPDELGAMDYILKDRNIRWMKTLPLLMEGGSQFIAVGALHLTGEYGLINLLQKQGYQVTPVSR